MDKFKTLVDSGSVEEIAAYLISKYFNGGSYESVKGLIAYYWCENVRIASKYFRIHAEAGVRYLIMTS